MQNFRQFRTHPRSLSCRKNDRFHGR